MTDVSKEQVLEWLRTVRGPDMDGNIVDLGLVSDVFISDGKAYFSITVPAERARELDPIAPPPSASSRKSPASRPPWWR